MSYRIYRAILCKTIEMSFTRHVLNNYINKVASYLRCVSFKTSLSFYCIHGRNVSFKIVLFLSVHHFNVFLLATFFHINKMSSVYFPG